MTNVRLPFEWTRAQQLTAWMLQEHNISIVLFQSKGHAWVRVSLPGYVTQEEVRRLGLVIQQFATSTDLAPIRLVLQKVSGSAV